MLQDKHEFQRAQLKNAQKIILLIEDLYGKENKSI
jgi:hypothetical protein